MQSAAVRERSDPTAESKHPYRQQTAEVDGTLTLPGAPPFSRFARGWGILTSSPFWFVPRNKVATVFAELPG